MLATLARRGCVISYAISCCICCHCFICSNRGDVEEFQIKFHVSHADHVNAEALINPTWTGTKEPMLERFWQSWNELRQRTLNPRLILRTNWPWDSASPLRAYLRSDGRLNRDGLFTADLYQNRRTDTIGWHVVVVDGNGQDSEPAPVHPSLRRSRCLYRKKESLRRGCPRSLQGKSRRPTCQRKGIT